MNKKVVSIILLTFILASLLINISFVSADGELAQATGEIGSQVWDTLTPIIKFLFNIEEDATVWEGTQTILSFILAFIIVFVFILLAFKNLPFFDDNPGLSYFIVVVSALLGIRGIAQIDPTIMNDIFMPYSALALSIINGAAIIGWFMLVNVSMKREDFTFIRRFLWILFAVTFIGIWGMRTIFHQGKEITGLTQWIYWATIILSIIMALIDGTIQGIWSKMKAEQLKHINKTKEIAEFQGEYKQYKDQLQDNTLTKEQYQSLMTDLRNRVKILLGTKFLKYFK